MVKPALQSIALKMLLLKILLSLALAFCYQALFAQGPLNALRFDGVDDYADLGANNRNITNSVTVEAWVKTGTAKYQWVVGKYDHGADKGYHLIIKDGRAAFAGRDGSGNYRNSGYSSTLVNDNNWHHLTGVCNNGTWLVYVDGILEKQFSSNYTFTKIASNAPMALGKDFLVNSEFYNGTMDEVRVWNKALTTDQIRQNMCQKIDPNSNGLVAYVKFDQSSTNTVQDISSTRINGNLRNMNPSTAWVTSGAPVGDKSTYRYENVWNYSLELHTDIVNFSVARAETGIKGFHLYQIATPPTNTTGLPNTHQVQEYYGLFKVGEPGKKYKIWFKQYSLSCGGKLYRRGDNTAPSWAVVADTVDSPGMTYNTTFNYGEFAATGNPNSSITVKGPTIICAGSNATLSVDPGTGTVKWSTGATTKSIQISKAGTYTVTVTDGKSCQRAGSITVQEAPPVTVNLGADRNLCFGEAVTLSAPSGMAAYRWSTGATSASITAATSGNYWVEVTNAAGCITRDEVKITVMDEPKLQWQSEAFVCNDKPVTLNATVTGATYLWSNGETTPTIEVKQPGLYKVQIMLNACTLEREAVVSADECPIIPNIITPNGDGKNDVFVVDGVEPSNFTIEIFNRWGKLIYQSVRYDNGWTAQGVPAGIYFYHLKSNRTQNTFKGWLEVIK